MVIMTSVRSLGPTRNLCIISKMSGLVQAWIWGGSALVSACTTKICMNYTAFFWCMVALLRCWMPLEGSPHSGWLASWVNVNLRTIAGETDEISFSPSTSSPSESGLGRWPSSEGEISPSDVVSRSWWVTVLARSGMQLFLWWLPHMPICLWNEYKAFVSLPLWLAISWNRLLSNFSPNLERPILQSAMLQVFGHCR